MRVSGERQRNSRKASPENFASATNDGRPGEQQDRTPMARSAPAACRSSQSNAVLDEAEAAHDQRQRATRGLAARARELVVELGILEVAQVERQRLLEDHFVDALPELRAQQRLARGKAALRGGEGRDQHAFERDVAEHVDDLTPVRAVHVHGSDDGVDDQCPDISDRRGQHARDQGQQRERNGELAAGGPDEVQRVARIAEHLGQRAQRAPCFRRLAARAVRSEAVNRACGLRPCAQLATGARRRPVPGPPGASCPVSARRSCRTCRRPRSASPVPSPSRRSRRWSPVRARGNTLAYFAATSASRGR